ncbi:MAG: hypothetical protein COB70_002850, partial [Rhodobiaceae bacterium]|nr:hypothetical protein [Rhodobiaceae bacterium]
MSTTDIAPKPASPSPLREKMFQWINKSASYLNVVGLGWLVPLFKILAGDNPKTQLKELWQQAGIPMLGIVAFLTMWAVLAPTVKTSLGTIPGPAQVWEQVEVLWEDHLNEREKEKAFFERQDIRNAKYTAEGRLDKVKDRAYTGKP